MMSRILVVDDEVNIRELMDKILSRAGHTVTTLPTAAQAYQMVLQTPFDLIILDIQIRAESGLELLKQIRAKNAKIPVIIYSGCVTPQTETEARAAGASEVLRKDIGTNILVAQINRVAAAKDRIEGGLTIGKEAPLLIVEDQDNIRLLVKGFFEGKGYSVLEARNGREAVEIVSKNPVAAVLLDIEMPVMDGLEALPQLLAINPRLGVVMTTGVLDDEKVRQAIALGAYGYVLKPYDFLYLELVVMSRLALAQA
jgi:CheY-like chemotaxis protein